MNYLFLELSEETLSNFSHITGLLPIAKANIMETSTLVVVTRIRYENIEILPGKSFVYSKSYGDESKLKITFPDGTVEEKCCFRFEVILIFSFLDTSK